MIEIFRQLPEVSVGVMRPTQWSFLQEGIKRNIATVESYYKEHNRPVKSNHFLVRLLQTINVSKSLPLNRYYENVDAMALNHSMALKMTSAIYKGNVFRGIFYGNANPEILIANDEAFDFEKVHLGWRDVSAVKLLLHPKTDMKYHLPNGVAYSDEYGLTVVLINVAMLAVQYRAFLINQSIVNKDDSPKGITHFIGGYVLPNMLKQQAELALFNQLYNKVNNVETKAICTRVHPFAFQDYSSFIDRYIDETAKILFKSSKSHKTILTVPGSIYNKSLYETLLLPDIIATRQVEWGLVAARLKMVDFIISVAGDEVLAKNQGQLNQILRDIRTSNVYNSFIENLPNDVFFDLEAYINNLLLVMGRKSI